MLMKDSVVMKQTCVIHAETLAVAITTDAILVGYLRRVEVYHMNGTARQTIYLTEHDGELSFLDAAGGTGVIVTKENMIKIVDLTSKDIQFHTKRIGEYEYVATFYTDACNFVLVYPKLSQNWPNNLCKG